ncbi:universal stress protein [Halostagnicola bangensis]
MVRQAKEATDDTIVIGSHGREEIASAYETHDVEVASAVRRGHPAHGIVAYAEDNDIILGRTGRTGVMRLMGSTADRVVRSTSIPVIVIPEPSDDS